VRELAAYLMMAAGQQLHFQQKVSVSIRKVAVAKLCKLGFGPGFAGDETLVQFFVALHPVFQQALLFGRRSTAQGQIGLVHLTVAEHRVQPFQGLGCLGKDAQPAHRPVQTVGNSEKHVPRLVVTFLYECFQGLA